VEIKEEVGDENIFIFGNTVDDVDNLRHQGYNPWAYYEGHDELKKAIDQIRDGFFNEDKELYHPIVDSLLNKGDYFLVLVDYEAYINKQAEVDELYRNQDEWNRKAILNTARVGKFSSDRTIREYAKEIWRVEVDR
ncbi:MAG: glycogen/starch/alpha-glucan phosphorylase, partial [Balneolaceae bacterium]|nr:glycogen/starch/alpha-glucan phosphorylase [Balneolaceae bacterium]